LKNKVSNGQEKRSGSANGLLVDSQKEYISRIVPKLKGESNFAQWQHRLYMALKVNNVRDSNIGVTR
jgi:hypothetical protein